MLLASQWRGGSTLAEGLIFTTSQQKLFLLDEPEFAVSELAVAHGRVLPNRLRSVVAAANNDALLCSFDRYNHTALREWQVQRARLTGFNTLRYRSFSQLRLACQDRQPEERALKTIRMIGFLGSYLEECTRSKQHGCKTILLVRHPLAIIRSRTAILFGSSKPSSIDLLERPELQPEAVCSLMLQDVRAVQQWNRANNVMLLKYSDILLHPRLAAVQAHEHLNLNTNQHVLDEFVRQHFDPSIGDTSVYGITRPSRHCHRTSSMAHTPICAALLSLLDPLYDC